MKKSLINFISDQLFTLPPVETTDLTGKTVMVVGANIGLGFEAARHFARMNPSKLFLACRSESKGKAAIADIESSTGFKSCELWIVDLGDFSSVVSFADKFQRERDRLDILIMNAGILNTEYQETVDGWEATLQVNHLGTTLLSLLLLPRLVDTGKRFGSASRLVIVSSDVHHWANIPDKAKQSNHMIAQLSGRDYRAPRFMAEHYSQSKLFNVFFARALQERLQSTTPLTVNSLNPGFCYSNIRKGQTIFYFIMEKLLAWTTEQGSRQLVYAAIGERDNEDHMKGAYVNGAKVEEPSDLVVSEEGKTMQNSVWEETVDILTKKAPQLSQIIQDYLV